MPGGLSSALELVRLIREEHRDWFSIGVAGYPEVHAECWNSPHLPPSEQARRRDVAALKAKVDAGADFVVTQFVCDAEVFVAFRDASRAEGVRVPIIAAQLVVQSARLFRQFAAAAFRPRSPQSSRRLRMMRRLLARLVFDLVSHFALS